MSDTDENPTFPLFLLSITDAKKQFPAFFDSVQECEMIVMQFLRS